MLTKSTLIIGPVGLIVKEVHDNRPTSNRLRLMGLKISITRPVQDRVTA